MLDIDWGKIVLIGVVALLVVAPKEWPRVIGALERWMDKIRS
jgi:Sec-independent protein translocase protein TatA